MRRTALLGCVTVAIATAWMLLGLPGVSPPLASSDATPGRSNSPSNALASGSDAGESRPDRRDSDPVVTFCVVDEAARPLEQAAILTQEATRHERFFDGSASGETSTTDAAGIAILPKRVAGSGRRFTVSKAGYSPAAVVSDGRDSYHIVLRAGLPAHVYAVDRWGQPVAGARVLASAHRLPEFSRLEPARNTAVWYPLSDRPIQNAVTDKAGHCVVHGLHAGPVYLDVLKDGHLLHSLTPQPRALPCGPITAVLDAMYVAVWDIAGDEQQASFASTPSGCRVIVSEKLSRFAARLRERLDCDGCQAFVPEDRVADSDLAHAAAEVRLLLRRKGFVSVRVPLQLARDDAAPFVVDASDWPDTVSTDVTVAIANGDGSFLPTGATPPLQLLLEGGTAGASFAVPITTGTPLHLPTGRYQVVAANGGMRMCLEGNAGIDVGADTHHIRLQLGCNAVALQVAAVDEDGVAVSYAAYQLEYVDSGRRVTGVLTNCASQHVWAPEGRARIRLQSDHSTAEITDFDLAADDQGRQVLQTVLRSRER